MQYIIHETYEYEVEANSADEALEQWNEWREWGEDSISDVIAFTQNYTTVLDSEGKEI